VAISSDETCRFLNSSVVNCRGAFSYFTCVFQPYDMCEQQFSFSFAFDGKLHIVNLHWYEVKLYFVQDPSSHSI